MIPIKKKQNRTSFLNPEHPWLVVQNSQNSSTNKHKKKKKKSPFFH